MSSRMHLQKYLCTVISKFLRSATASHHYLGPVWTAGSTGKMTSNAWVAFLKPFSSLGLSWESLRISLELLKHSLKITTL